MFIDQLKEINAYPNLGSVKIIDREDTTDGFTLQPEDIAISADFSNDDLTNDDEINRFADWYNNVLWISINKLITSNGYVSVYEYDNSGNGLYYGCEVFRKIA